MRETPAHGAREHDALEVAAFFNEIFELIAVRNASDILLDDGAVIQHFGDIVAGGADQLHAALKSPVIWFRAREGGQERVVNVDDAVRVSGYEFGREDLHVAGEDYEINAVP